MLALTGKLDSTQGVALRSLVYFRGVVDIKDAISLARKLATDLFTALRTVWPSYRTSPRLHPTVFLAPRVPCNHLVTKSALLGDRNAHPSLTHPEDFLRCLKVPAHVARPRPTVRLFCP